MSLLDITGWVVWAIVLIVALALTYGLMQRRTATRGTLLLIFLLWIELAILFLKPAWSKLHLLWLVPLSVIAMSIYSYSLGWRAGASASDSDI